MWHLYTFWGEIYSSNKITNVNKCDCGWPVIPTVIKALFIWSLLWMKAKLTRRIKSMKFISIHKLTFDVWHEARQIWEGIQWASTGEQCLIQCRLSPNCGYCEIYAKKPQNTNRKIRKKRVHYRSALFTDWWHGLLLMSLRWILKIE